MSDLNNNANNTGGGTSTPPEGGHQARSSMEQNSSGSQERRDNYQAGNYQTSNPYMANQQPVNGAYHFAGNQSRQTPPASGQYQYNAFDRSRAPGAAPVYGQPYGAEEPKEKKPKKKLATWKIVLIVVLCVAIVASGIGGGLYLALRSGDDAGDVNVETQNTPQINVEDIPDSGALTPEQIAAKVKPSVVAILTYNNTTSASGSGVVMGEDSTHTYTYFLTCAHMLDDFTNAVVQLEDETQYDAEIVGYDNRTDIGVVRVKATGFTAAEFGDSTKLQVGNDVYAIGNPGGTSFYGSFTEGIVSAIDRPVNSEQGYTQVCIQHTAAINSGNSGGALVNEYGQVIGINSSKIAESSFEGMGFAVPIATAKSIAESIIANGYVPGRPMLGIQYTSVYSNSTYAVIAQIANLPKGSIVVSSIAQNSSFSGTDVQPGDIITQVNGKDLENSDSLREVVDASKVGDKLTLTICRVSANYEITQEKVEITLIEDKGDTTYSSGSSNQNDGSNSGDNFFWPF